MGAWWMLCQCQAHASTQRTSVWNIANSPANQMSRHRGRFAIGIVIIGLLLGGVPYGAGDDRKRHKVKNGVNDMNGRSMRPISRTLDRFRRLPGDDGPNLAALTGRGGSWATVTQAGNNNGVPYGKRRCIRRR